jgi:hypothetical protein
MVDTLINKYLTWMKPAYSRKLCLTDLTFVRKKKTQFKVPEDHLTLYWEAMLKAVLNWNEFFLIDVQIYGLRKATTIGLLSITILWLC